MVSAINSVIPKATTARARMVSNLGTNFKKFDVILGTTNGKSIINSDHVNTFKKNVVVIDIGKGIFKREALIKAINNNINLFRLDITPAYDGHLENIFSTEKINNFNLAKSKTYKNITLIKKGILCLENSVIVDNVKSPKIIYGISDGYGSFKKISEKKIIKIKKVIKFNK